MHRVRRDFGVTRTEGGDVRVSWFCPLDCSACWDHACIAGGCKRTGHSALAACDSCGTLFVGSALLFCSECAQEGSSAASAARSRASTRERPQ
jgi:hypothetical protein